MTIYHVYIEHGITSGQSLGRGSVAQNIIDSDLDLDQTVLSQAEFTRILNQTLVFDQVVTQTGSIYSPSIVSNLTITQDVSRESSIWIRDIDSEITIAQSAGRMIEASIVSYIGLTQAFYRGYPVSIQQTLELSQANSESYSQIISAPFACAQIVGTQTTYSRSITTTLVLDDSVSKIKTPYSEDDMPEPPTGIFTLL